MDQMTFDELDDYEVERFDKGGLIQEESDEEE